jgi:hypothetical protein
VPIRFKFIKLRTSKIIKLMNIINRICRKIRHVRRENSIKGAHEKHRSEFESDYGRIDEIINAFRDSGGLRHGFQHYKLWCIEQLLADRKPSKILEFGTGSSTLIFADYIKKYGGRLTSVDENEEWANNTLSLLGNLKDSDIEVRSVGKIFNNLTIPHEMKYDMKFEEEYDLVFIDGPSFMLKDISHKGSINSNIFELPFTPKSIVVDGRKETALEISRRYSAQYNYKLSDLFSGNVVTCDYYYLSTFFKLK